MRNLRLATRRPRRPPFGWRAAARQRERRCGPLTVVWPFPASGQRRSQDSDEHHHAAEEDLQPSLHVPAHRGERCSLASTPNRLFKSTPARYESAFLEQSRAGLHRKKKKKKQIDKIKIILTDINNYINCICSAGCLMLIINYRFLINKTETLNSNSNLLHVLSEGRGSVVQRTRLCVCNWLGGSDDRNMKRCDWLFCRIFYRPPFFSLSRHTSIDRSIQIVIERSPSPKSEHVLF